MQQGCGVRHIGRSQSLLYRETKGYDEVCAGDNCYEGRSNNFRYEVYEGDSYIILDEDGDVAEFKNTVYETELFYCD